MSRLSLKTSFFILSSFCFLGCVPETSVDITTDVVEVDFHVDVYDDGSAEVTASLYNSSLEEDPLGLEEGSIQLEGKETISVKHGADAYQLCERYVRGNLANCDDAAAGNRPNDPIFNWFEDYYRDFESVFAEDDVFTFVWSRYGNGANAQNNVVTLAFPPVVDFPGGDVVSVGVPFVAGWPFEPGQETSARLILECGYSLDINDQPYQPERLAPDYLPKMQLSSTDLFGSARWDIDLLELHSHHWTHREFDFQVSTDLSSSPARLVLTIPTQQVLWHQSDRGEEDIGLDYGAIQFVDDSLSHYCRVEVFAANTRLGEVDEKMAGGSVTASRISSSVFYIDVTAL